MQDFVLLTDARPLLVRLHVRLDGKPYQPLWDDFVKHLFRSLDKDGDGGLNREEFERIFESLKVSELQEFKQVADHVRGSNTALKDLSKADGILVKNEGIDGLIAALNRKADILTATTAKAS